MKTSSTVQQPPDTELRPLNGTELNLQNLGTYLRSAGISLDLDFPPGRFPGGLANRNYLLRGNDEWMVLRCPPPGPLPPGAHDMRREHQILSRLWEALPLAPRSYHLCEDATVIGVPFQLLEFRSGTSIRGDRLAPLEESTEIGASLSALLVRTLAAIHAVEPPQVGLEKLGRPDGFFERTRDGWLGRAARLDALTAVPDAATVASWLQDVATPRPSVAVLLHNDFKLDNILLNPESMTALAVLDWDMGTRGPAESDLATLLSYWAQPDDRECMHRLAQMPTARPGFMSRNDVLLTYENITGRRMPDVRPYRVLAIFRLATVFLQLHQLFLNNTVSDPRYASFEQLGTELFSVALDVISERSL